VRFLGVIMINGKWVKYDINSNINQLINSVKDVNADWRRVTNPDIINYTLDYNNGEIYVYYTIDKNNNYTVPRMFIEVTRNGGYPRIGLVYGIEKYENVECELLDILKNKLDEIGDKKFLYNERIADIKLLNHIYEKHNKGETLTVDEIKFLYEFDREIRYFGFSKDNKVAELRKARKNMGDMNQVFRAMDDYDGDIEFSFPSYSDGSIFPKHIKGNFVLKKIKNLVNCILPLEVEGDIVLPNVKSMKYVLCGKNVSGSILVPSLETTDHVIFANNVKKDFKACSLQKVSNTVFSRNVRGDMHLECLKEAKNSVWPENVDELMLLEYEGDNLVSPSSFNRLMLPVGCSVSEMVSYPTDEKERIEKEVLKKILKR